MHNYVFMYLFLSYTDFKFTRKRDRNPPPYSLHCSSHAVSIPSCPVYGTIQPSEAECKTSSILSLLFTFALFEVVKAYSKAVSRISPPGFSSPSSKHTELVDEGIQTNLLEDQDNGSTYRDDEFIQQTQSSQLQLSVNVPDSSLEPGELHLAARYIGASHCLPASSSSCSLLHPTHISLQEW